MNGFTSLKIDNFELHNLFLVIISGHYSDISDLGTVLGFSAILLPQLGQVGPPYINIDVNDESFSSENCCIYFKSAYPWNEQSQTS